MRRRATFNSAVPSTFGRRHSPHRRTPGISLSMVRLQPTAQLPWPSTVFGNFGGLESTTQLGNFSVTMASGTTNTLDFIFTGCSSGFPCGNSAVYALLVDPSWSQAGASATLDTIPESLLIADGGIAPVVPLPASVWMLLGGLGTLGLFARKRRATPALRVTAQH